MASLTLLLDGRAWREEIEVAAPALETLLSKGSKIGSDEGSAAFLLKQFGFEPDIGEAAIRALGDGLDSTKGWWLCADPVHMVADRDQLFLSASSSLGLSQKEADSLVAELNKVYRDDGWAFFAPTPQRWYLQLPTALALQTTPTEAAMGRRVGEVLPQGGDAMSWQRVMTEVQMLMHSSSVNLQRSAEGKLAVNGLWFWGGGDLPQKNQNSDWSGIVADDALLSGLARLHGLEIKSYTPELIKRIEGRALWQLTVDSLASLEASLFMPLLNGLNKGSLQELNLVIPGIGIWSVNKKALRRWWRRRKPLLSLLGDKV